MMPNRLRAPLTPDEALGEQYSDQPGFLREIALETGNRALVGIAQAIGKEKRRQFKEARQRHVAPASAHGGAIMSHEDFGPNIGEQLWCVNGQINVALKMHRAALDRLAKAKNDVRQPLKYMDSLRTELKKIEGWKKEIEAMEQAEVPQ